MENKLQNWVIPTVIGVASFGLGVGTGYLLCKMRINQKPEVVVEAEEESEEDRQYQLDFRDAERDRTLNKTVMEMQQVISDLKGVDPKEEFRKKAAKVRVVPEEPPIDKRIVDADEIIEGEEMAIHQEDILVTRVFNERSDDWDYDYEIAHREPPKPYIIHRDEYDEMLDEYRQCALTYYEGDNIFTDEHDVPVYDAETIVGKVIFGHGSEDPSICFVRNEKLEADFEIILDHGSYQQEVLGEQIEHSMRRAAPKPKFHLE